MFEYIIIVFLLFVILYITLTRYKVTKITYHWCSGMKKRGISKFKCLAAWSNNDKHYAVLQYNAEEDKLVGNKIKTAIFKTYYKMTPECDYTLYEQVISSFNKSFNQYIFRSF